MKIILIFKKKSKQGEINVDKYTSGRIRERYERGVVYQSVQLWQEIQIGGDPLQPTYNVEMAPDSN